MTEQEYVDATNLVRIRMALTILDECSLDSLLPAYKTLREIEDALAEVVGVRG